MSKPFLALTETGSRIPGVIPTAVEWIDLKTFIIAEAGVNHNGSIDRAKKLIECAAEAGADAIKFQTFQADKVGTSANLIDAIVSQVQLPDHWLNVRPRTLCTAFS